MTEMGTCDRGTPSVTELVVRAAIQFAVAIGIWGGLLFWAAGTLLWSRGWIHLGLWTVTALVNLAVLLRWNREVLAARLKPKRTSQHFDTFVLTLFAFVTAAVPVAAGLDAVRYQWAPLATWAVGVGIAVHAAGDAVLLWTMVVNPFLEKTVRIQTERGHRVITTGPYRFARHPMYVGVALMCLAVPLVLGSAWTFVPVAAMTLLLAMRTIPEERMLRRELPGYEEYMRKTRYRMIPGIW